MGYFHLNSLLLSGRVGWKDCVPVFKQMQMFWYESGQKLSARTRLEKLQNVQKVFVWYSFQPWSLLSAPSLFNISPPPPLPESARCDYSDLAIANIRLRPSILFLACHLVWLHELKTWLCQTTEKGRICSCCLSRTLLFSYIFRVSPFAWRCMTCFPRFSAVSIWEKATGLGFLLGWGVGL